MSRDPNAPSDGAVKQFVGDVAAELARRAEPTAEQRLATAKAGMSDRIRREASTSRGLRERGLFGQLFRRQIADAESAEKVKHDGAAQQRVARRARERREARAAE